MEKKYGLSQIEWDIMSFLWHLEKRSNFKDLMNYVNEELRRNWKKQTLSTYLKNLQLMGLIAADTSQKNFIYYPIITQEQYIQTWTSDLIAKQYDNSIANFITAFSGGKNLSREDADELKKLL